jgi:hypothetical protein
LHRARDQRRRQHLFEPVQILLFEFEAALVDVEIGAREFLCGRVGHRVVFLRIRLDERGQALVLLRDVLAVFQVHRPERVGLLLGQRQIRGHGRLPALFGEIPCDLHVAFVGAVARRQRRLFGASERCPQDQCQSGHGGNADHVRESSLESPAMLI